MKQLKLLHIYGQDSHHAGAFIVGNREGLIELIGALSAATLVDDDCKAKVYVSDGEGYEVHCLKLEGNLGSPQWIKMAEPYTAEWAREYQKQREWVVWPEDLLRRQSLPLTPGCADTGD